MDKKLIGLMMIFMLSFGLFTTITVFNKPLSRLTKAKEEFMASSETSKIFAWPLTSVANGKFNVSVNVFIRNSNNVPLPNKKVRISSSLGSIKDNDQITDNAGKATFQINSETQGISDITAIVDNLVQLKHHVTVEYK